jgi:segregation and condensation protein B
METAAPDLRRVVGAMIFAAPNPVSADDIFRCLKATAENGDGVCRALGDARAEDVEAAVADLREALRALGAGFVIEAVAGGYRLQSDGTCGAWLRHLLDAGRPSRLSMPALETLAIVAYRQPITRPEIESIRGVNVDHVMRSLLEMQLIRICGRSALPGRPFQYGTTQLFLEHFGLRSLDDLHGAEPQLTAKGLRERSEQAAADAEAGDDDAEEEDGDDDAENEDGDDADADGTAQRD